MDEQELRRAVFFTRVHRKPIQKIYTFGETEFIYHIVSPENALTIIRKGKLTCDKPLIITAETIKDTFGGFDVSAIELVEKKYPELFKQLRGLGYQVRNQLISIETVDETQEIIIDRIKNKINENDSRTAILSAPDNLWMFAVLRLTADLIRKSSNENMRDLEERGFFKTTEERINEEIEFLFSEAQTNKAYIKELADRLQEYGLFEKYEDRFFKLVKH